MTEVHLTQPVVTAGPSPETARAGAVLVHGRDQDPAFMLDLVRRLDLDDVAYCLPTAAGGSWYPGRFYDPVEDNEPSLGYALRACAAAVEQILAAGVPLAKTSLVGFSQGACLVAELAFRRPRGYGAMGILTGSLMGGEHHHRDVPSGLAGVPVFLGSSVVDPWIPIDDVEQTARLFERADASVTFRRYADTEHAIYDDEVEVLRDLLMR